MTKAFVNDSHKEYMSWPYVKQFQRTSGSNISFYGITTNNV